MSSDLLEIDDDPNGNSIFIDMNAEGQANITILGTSGDGTEYFSLYPNPDDVKKAKQIAQALLNWAEYIEEEP